MPDTGVTAVKAGRLAQVASPGPNRLKMMVPPGLPPPDSIAVSCTEPPTGTDAEAVVARVGDALPGVTVTVSNASRQAVIGIETLLASPL